MSVTVAGVSAKPAKRVGRLEPAALAGVMSRDVVIFKRYWKATTFSSVVQPTIYLLAFGLGIGALRSHIGPVKTIEYIATGTVATAVLFSSAFPGMFNTFIRWQFQRTYDAMLAAPVDVEELITAEVVWISLRAGVYGLAPLLVGFAFGLEPEVGMLLVVRSPRGAELTPEGAILAGHLSGPKTRIALAAGLGAGLDRTALARLLADPAGPEA